MTYFRFERHIDSCRKTPYCRRALVSLSVCLSVRHKTWFLPARRYAGIAGVALCMSVCMCLSQVGVLSKRLN